MNDGLSRIVSNTSRSPAFLLQQRSFARSLAHGLAHDLIGVAGVVVLMLFTTFAFTVEALTPTIASYQWELKREQKDIRIYTSKVLGSEFLAIKGEMHVNAKVSALVALVKDVARCPEWADLCRESRIVEQSSANAETIYMLSDAPFPIQDRDVVARTLWQTDTLSGRVSMLSTAMSLVESSVLMPLQKNTLRVINADTQWHFTPVSDSVVLVENFAHIDPTGPMPAWIINLLSINSPFKSLREMRKIIESESESKANTELGF